jgi:DnaJ-class molecular chaperone
MQLEHMTECIVSTGHLCGYCQGNGWFWGKDDPVGTVKEPCPMCGGSGELDAVITVNWKPSKEKAV